MVLATSKDLNVGLSCLYVVWLFCCWWVVDLLSLLLPFTELCLGVFGLMWMLYYLVMFRGDWHCIVLFVNCYR